MNEGQGGGYGGPACSIWLAVFSKVLEYEAILVAMMMIVTSLEVLLAGWHEVAFRIGGAESHFRWSRVPYGACSAVT